MSRPVRAWMICAGLSPAVFVPGLASSQEAADGQLQEVTVTAQYRSQNLQDTPLSISAISGEALAERNVVDIAQAGNLIPNVNLTKNAGGFGQMASIYIRGVGQSDPHFAVEPGVGMYVDDVYYGVMPGAVFQLLDTDRVEILRGPQGTLAGKNSLGGSIKLFSKRPTSDPDAYVELGYGSDEYFSGRAASNFTLVPDKLLARISIAGQRRDGYFDRLDYACANNIPSGSTQRTVRDCKLGTQGGMSTVTGRFTLSWNATDNINDTLIADIAQDNSENPAAKTFYAPTVAPLFGTPTWATGSNYITGPHSYTNYENNLPTPKEPGAVGPVAFPNTSPLSASGLTNDLKINLTDNLRLESITGYRRSTVHFYNQIDGSPASVNDQSWRLDHKQFTEELRLSGEIGSFADWTFGGYYYKADGISEGRIIIPFGLAPGGGGGGILSPADILFRDPVTTESKSVFAFLALHPIEKMTVTVGGRYTEDSKDFKFLRYNPLTGLPNPAYLYDVTVKYDGSRPDYRLNVSYEWTDNFMTYAQVASGYRGGGVNPRPFFPSQALPYNPETITAYEAGLKSEFFDRHMSANLAAFVNSYKGFQAAVRRCDAISPFPGAPCNQTTNVGNAHVKGVEFETALMPVGGLRFDLSAGWLDFEYTKVNPASGITLDMTNAFSPKWNGSAGLQYAFNIGGAGTITPRIDYSYRSKMQTAAVNEDLTELNSLWLLNARVSWQNADKGWEAALAATNLTDKFYFQSKQVLSSPTYNVASATPGLPRLFVFTVKRSF
jgi:iron complex outermembrane receptor protein